MPDRPPVAPRVAQPPGKTFLEFSSDGKRMLVAGCADYARSFRTNDEGEPDMLSHVQDDTLAVACGNDYAILGAEDGTVSEYAVTGETPKNELKEVLVRFSLPVRALALSPDGAWIAASSDEVEVKVVNRQDIEQIHVLRNHTKPIKHLSYDPAGTLLAASCTDGKIYMYNVEEGQPRFVRAIDGVIQRLETADDATSKCFWHPAGQIFACATASREVLIVNAADGKIQKRFAGLHNSPITSISWTPNGRIIASAAIDGSLIVWDARSQQVLQQHTYEKILNIEWHNKGDNLFCWANSWGEVYITPNFLHNEAHVQLLKAPLDQPADTLQQKITQPTGPRTNGVKPLVHGRPRARTPDSLDDYLGDAAEPELEDNWIDDDDGAGYKNQNGKRPSANLINLNGDPGSKRARHSLWQPQIHDSFQPGATPWRGNRKYLCLNLTGFIWTIDQSTHNTVTVEFYDRETHRDFHFTDPFQYDKACLNEHGALFSAPPNPAQNQPAVLFYRPHETWTARSDFRVQLPDGEDVSCIALSSRYVVACTTKNYVRVYTLFGTPLRVWRLKSSPAVTCAAYSDYLMTVGNGAVNSDGTTQLIYDIVDLRHDETCQSSDLVALGVPHPDADDDESIHLRTLFWTDTGDPAIYDSTGTLLVLLHWRTPGQAKWVPLLDTRLLERLQDGRKEETYWPVAVADQKFHCIILKGGDQYPYFPRPLLSEFELNIPIGRPIPKRTAENGEAMDDGEETVAHQTQRMEETFVRSSLMMSLLDDYITSQGDHARHTDKTELARREIEVDKVLLQLLAAECREGEERGMKALEIVKLMRDRGGKMVEAASRVAGRFGRTVLEEKIREEGERRLGGTEEDN